MAQYTLTTTPSSSRAASPPNGFERRIIPINPERRLALFGAADKNLRLLREMFGVQVASRDDELRLSGDALQVERAASVVGKLITKLRKQEWLSDLDVSDAVRSASAEPRPTDGALDVFARGQQITGKTEGQRAYLAGMMKNDLTFCVGPAGSGKTYLAVAVAAHLLKHGIVKKIVLARPAVEAGEKLGFLPGDLAAKVNPYLRPLFDALNDMIDFEQVKRFMASDVVEVVPLAFMRGRTLNDAAIILDEAQNTTTSQMLMFLTRLGHGSKMIVTGDPSQTDLPRGTDSGLEDAVDRLRGLRNIFMCHLDKMDIVRHRLVQNIVMAYSGNHNSPPARGLDARSTGVSDLPDENAIQPSKDAGPSVAREPQDAAPASENDLTP